MVVKCPECGHFVSEQTPTCPHCGFNFNDVADIVKEADETKKAYPVEETEVKQSYSAPVAPPPVMTKESQRTKSTMIALIVLLSVILVGMLAFLFLKDSPIPEQNTAIAAVDSTEIIKDTPDKSDIVISFLTNMYEESLFNDYSFISEHCTRHLLSVLASASEPDLEGGPYYATQLFRTSSQGEKSPTENSNRVISIKDIGNDWYECEFYDNGWRGVKRIKASLEDDEVMMDVIETVYDEAAEYRMNNPEADVVEVFDSVAVDSVAFDD